MSEKLLQSDMPEHPPLPIPLDYLRAYQNVAIMLEFHMLQNKFLREPEELTPKQEAP